MIHVYEIPENRSDGYCFGGAVPISFGNVDWFSEPGDSGWPEMTDEQIINFIKTRNYYRTDRSFLVLMSERALVIPAHE